ncbi:MAG TPA: dTDP-4-dehydrorhamnose 3,5-epimerase [Luteibaculaceae bacterium]|nr:dTDP-4-dehydrorhamnose 3,5-epimerase [Luteibaculaceae bacterium]
MEIIETGFDQLWLIKPTIFGDSRGYFYESYNQEVFRNKTGLDINFVQDNQSLSKKGVVRGLHFQHPPRCQDKLVRVLQGSVLDVVVDLRKDQPTYGKHYSVELTGENHLQLFVPQGFAHGFSTLEDGTIFAYKCSDVYAKESEGCILWNDPQLGIDWQIENPVISEKDTKGEPFSQFVSPF